MRGVDGPFSDRNLKTEVSVRLKRPPLAKLDSGGNYFRFRLGPNLSLSLSARIKQPGPGFRSMPTELSAIKKTQCEELGPYERLLADAMHGNAMLYVRKDAVEAEWAIVEPILGKVKPLHIYEPGTWGPTEADRLAAALGGWHNPQKEP